MCIVSIRQNVSQVLKTHVFPPKPEEASQIKGPVALDFTLQGLARISFKSSLALQMDTLLILLGQFSSL